MLKLEDLTVGTIIKNKDGKIKVLEVLGICGLVILCSTTDDFNSFGSFYTIEELNDYGFELATPKRWKPEPHTKFWYVDSVGYIEATTWGIGDSADEYRYQTGNCFPTREGAEAYKARLLAEGEKE